MTSIDHPGSYYLGRRQDLATGTPAQEPLLYDSADLTTHAVCVGMTGSGKTGLCLTLLEEAALGGVPAIAIDPKGDLGDLLLAFPSLQPSDFRPWIDPTEATRHQMSPDEFAAAQAELWREGLAKWGQGPDRIRRYCNAADRIIYTPGSSAGIPITILKSFQAPPGDLSADPEAFGERVAAATSGLLALLGLDADPLRSREHIYLSNVFDAAWRAGQNLDLRQLIERIQRPPFNRVGVVDLESFYPSSERYKLAMSLNNLLASPSFAPWLQGEPLEIQRILYTPEGKPRLAVMSIAHLDDAQRMFFVTILLNEVLSWMRTQPGTSSLRALLYMDEVFGYFPPLANPPAKRPMLTLLKQARAYGLGCVLATQNPVDLDYKGLSNAGTWFLGRLQTERDKARVIEGLEGASAESGAQFNRQQMEATLAALGKRVFLMNNVRQNVPVVFQTRWAMSYLCGPLTRVQIKSLMDPVRQRFASSTLGAQSPTGGPLEATTAMRQAAPTDSRAAKNRTLLPAAITEQFVAMDRTLPEGSRLEYRPALVGTGKVHFLQSSNQIDQWRDCYLLLPASTAPANEDWNHAIELPAPLARTSQPDVRGTFAELPSSLAREKTYPLLRRQLAEHLYRTQSLTLWQSVLFEQVSRADESEAEFRSRLASLSNVKRDTERERVEQQFAKKLSSLDGRIRVAQTRVGAEKVQLWTRIGGFAWTVAEGVMRMRGRGRRGRPRSAETAMRGVATEHGQQASAQAALDKLTLEKQSLEQQRDQALAELDAKYDRRQLALERLELKPRKADIVIDAVVLVWLPYCLDAEGHITPACNAVSAVPPIDATLPTQ